MSELRTVRGGGRDGLRRVGSHRCGPHLFGFLLLLLIPVLSACDEEGEPETAADFTLTLFDGGSFRLADHRGAPVIVNFFASWCIPCIAEAPALEAIHGEYAERGVTIIGVAVQDTEAKAREFVAKHGLTFPTGLDEGPIKEAYGVFGVPTTFFIDKEGLIRYTHAGVVTEDLLRYELEKIL